ncbi:hypothetical protein FCM35_KLT08608 [Carex littledalei]|uniref:Zinc finger PHD-type domain-containing protein n=1 Tax=Carex littledalei TaxID=544730 RepID=A0A833QY12_9POAL|nr:hypothetical protein FCM35_KLT08608 [Carex littledalei]
MRNKRRRKKSSKLQEERRKSKSHSKHGSSRKPKDGDSSDSNMDATCYMVEVESEQEEFEFGYITHCGICDQKGNSWDMFECKECGSSHHPSCASPKAAIANHNDPRFDIYECPNCIYQQVQKEIRAKRIQGSSHKAQLGCKGYRKHFKAGMGRSPYATKSENRCRSKTRNSSRAWPI